jgi:hypothetical protein
LAVTGIVIGQGRGLGLALRSVHLGTIIIEEQRRLVSSSHTSTFQRRDVSLEMAVLKLFTVINGI